MAALLAITDAKYIREAFELRGGKLFWLRRPDHHFVSLVAGRRWNTRLAGQAACICVDRYPSVRLAGRKLYVHRVVWALTYGYLPKEIDHINGDKTDFRLENLRDASRSAQCRNMPRGKNNTSGVTGVTFAKRQSKWQAGIFTKESGYEFLGYFDTVADAAAVRRARERELGFSEHHGREQCPA